MHGRAVAPDLPPIDELNVELHPARLCADACNAARDWPLRAARARAERTSCTLGDCMAATLQACFRYVPAHGFEIFRAAPATPTVELVGLDVTLDVCLRVRACPSAYDVANGIIVRASPFEPDETRLSGFSCLRVIAAAAQGAAQFCSFRAAEQRLQGSDGGIQQRHCDAGAR